MRIELISAIKRNVRKDILAELLEELGLADRAETVREANKVTTALIDRVCAPVKTDDEMEQEILQDLPKEPAPSMVDEIESAIAEGYLKDAKKAIKALGKDHSEYKRLKKELKGAKNG